MSFAFKIFLTLSLILSPLGALSAPISQGGDRNLEMFATKAVADIRKAGDIELKSEPSNLKLDGINFSTQVTTANWKEGANTYSVITTSFVTSTPAEYDAGIRYVQSSARLSGSNGNVNVMNIVPDSAAGREMTTRLEAAFTASEVARVLTLPMTPQKLTALEKKLQQRGGILGKLQKSLRSAANWLTDRPNYYQKIFVGTRVLLNGTAAATSFLLSYNGIHPAVAVSAGISAGLLSGMLQKFAKYYAHFLVTDGPVAKFFQSSVRKLLPFISPLTTDKWISKLASLGKYSGLEVLFVSVPVGIFFASDTFSGVLESTQWLTSMVGTGFEQFTYNFDIAKFAVMVGASVYGQYPWDKTVAQLNEIDLAQANGDVSQEKWIDFRTKAYFLGISAISVLALALSFGNEPLGYSILAALGSLGIYVGHKTVKKAKFIKATCEEFLTIRDRPIEETFITIPIRKTETTSDLTDKTGS